MNSENIAPYLTTAEKKKSTYTTKTIIQFKLNDNHPVKQQLSKVKKDVTQIFDSINSFV